MSRSTAILFLLCIAAATARSQSPTPSGPGPYDTTQYGSGKEAHHALDSAYRARKAILDKWIVEQRKAAGHPQEDFLSVYLGYGGLVQMQPHDINQFFSERVYRPDPQADANTYGNADRFVLLAGEAQLAHTWGIYVEYDYTARYSDVIIDSNVAGLQGADEALDLTVHSFSVGGMYVLYTSRFYRLKVHGGLGGIIATTFEQEQDAAKHVTSRSASATGYTVNFDIMNDLRVAENVSFTIDFFTRSVTTGKLKTSDNTTLDAPFGHRTTPLTVSPTASNTMFGIAGGIVYYF